MIRLYEIQSSSKVSATASRFSIFLIRFLPKERILKLSIPDKLLIFSMALVERARCLMIGQPTACVDKMAGKMLETL